MTRWYDDEVLLLRPMNLRVNDATIEQHLEETPGAFRDPHEPSTWILAMHPQYVEKLRQARIEDPRSFSFDPRVVVSPGHVVVYPGTTGHGRKFVHWLLSQGPCELIVRGQVVGPVTLPSDIYADEEWDDPDLDPTESPPRTGTNVVIERFRLVGGDVSENVIVHDAGVMSYEQIYPVNDLAKTYRRLSPALLTRWLILTKPLPITGDAPGPDGEYVDPVFLRIETPIEVLGMPKIDAARPKEHYRELLSLVNEWTTALRQDRAAMPPGLLIYP